MNEHLSTTHRATLGKLLAADPGHHLAWAEVRSLLEAVGTVHDHDGGYRVTVGERHVDLERSHRNEIDEPSAAALRTLLKGAGYQHAV